MSELAQWNRSHLVGQTSPSSEDAPQSAMVAFNDSREYFRQQGVLCWRKWCWLWCDLPDGLVSDSSCFGGHVWRANNIVQMLMSADGSGFTGSFFACILMTSSGN